jgi:hypothetical protein
MKHFLIVSLLLLLGGAPSLAQSGDTSTLTIQIEGSAPLVWHGSDLSAVKRVQAVVKDTSGKEETFSGFNLIDLLAKAGAPTGKQLRGANMSKYVLVKAKDGYGVLFSLAELDSVFSKKLILLADQRNGQPLGKDKGPFRIVIPEESRHARWIWGVQGIVVGTVKL